jgi:hypothetical protein
MFGLNFGATSSSGDVGVYDFENALQFDGVDDYVNFTEQTYSTTVFSASFWIKYTNVRSNGIIFGSDSNSNRYFRLDSETQFSMRTRSAGASIDTFTVPALANGIWYHIAVSLDNGTNLLWINGNQYSSNASVNYAAETVAVGRIGGRSDTTQMTEAIIDDFIIQSTVLDQTEVDSIYNSGAGNLPTTVFSNSDVYFKFNESSGTSAADSSGNSNTGTLNNFTGTYFIPHLSPIEPTPLFWLDARVGITQSGGAVSKWADQSGNSNDFLQSSGSLQPTYDATGLNILPTLIFNNKELVSGVLSSPISNITVYCVWKMDTNYNGGTILGQTSGANNKRFFWYDPADSIYYWDGGTNSKILAASDDPLVSAEAFVIRSDSSGNGEGRVNDDAFSAEDNVTGLTTSSLAMTVGNRGAGAARRLQGRISQLIVYSGEHTDTQVDSVMNYLNSIYPIWGANLEARAYIAAAGITNATEIAAVKQLVLDLKGLGNTTNDTDVWTKLEGIYPISPTSLTAATFNLKDPSAFGITWFNSPVHSALGVAFGGTRYGSIAYNPSVDGLLDDHSYGINVSVFSSTGLASVMGSRQTSGSNYYNSLTQYQGNTYWAVHNASGFNFAGNLSTGHYIANRDSSTTSNLYKDGVEISTQDVASTGRPNANYGIACQLVGTSPSAYANMSLDFAHIGLALTDDQAEDLSDAITAYNTAVR